MEPEGSAGTGGHATWTSTWSAYMLEYLANLVVNGTKTSSSYKMIHYNGCAKALREKFGIVRSGEQVKNHLKTWQKKFRKICELRGLSGAGWDEDTCSITLDDEHYNNHVKDHKSDADFLNKPIQHFEEMNIIFGSTMATGKFAKEAGKSDNDVPADLFDNVMSMTGFNPTHLSFYHSYLVQHPHIARAFNSLPFEHKLNWVAKHIAENYPGQ